jgi:hypothetical protein
LRDEIFRQVRTRVPTEGHFMPSALLHFQGRRDRREKFHTRLHLTASKANIRSFVAYACSSSIAPATMNDEMISCLGRISKGAESGRR